MESLDSEALKFRFALRMVSTVALLTLLVLSLVAYYFLPRTEQIMLDMLGSRDRLPTLTRMMFDWGRINVIGFSVQCFVCAAALFFAFLPRSRFAGLGALAGIVILALHFVVCAVSVVLPMVQIITGIGSP